jgi:S-adenosylmethionine decarboxylase
LSLEVESMRLYTLDVRVRDPAVLVDRGKLRAVLYAAADEGGARVVGEAFHVFPNGAVTGVGRGPPGPQNAVTGVLLLAQSHLSIHTWPELALANVDLLTYGDVDGELALAVVREQLDAVDGSVTVTGRG